MFKDVSDDSQEVKNELRDLPDEIVDSDGTDDLPDEIVDSDGVDDLPDEIVDSDSTDDLPDEIVDLDSTDDLPDEIVDSDVADNSSDEVNVSEKTGNESKEIQQESKPDAFSDLDTMLQECGKSYTEIKAEKPPHSPNAGKWFDRGVTIKVLERDGKVVWIYTDRRGREVAYVDGYIIFPPEAKHPVFGDINIGEFTGDRREDKRRYLEKLEEQYGLTEIPHGYVLHHDSENGNMQLVKEDWHKEFTHTGGHSLHKED